MTVVATSAPGALQKLAASAVPFIIAPTGTMANNGAITLGTALPTTYAKAFIYLPLNAIQAGSAAGWYYVQMSSTTLGVVFNNTYTTGVPTIPTSPTAFVTTGPGAFTGVTTAVNGPTFTVPAGIVGANGGIRVTHLWSVPNNANSKTTAFYIGPSAFYFSALGAILNNSVQTEIFNRGSLASQVATPAGSSGIGQASQALGYYTVNFGASQSAIFQGQLAVATDYIVMEAFMAEVVQG